MIEALVVQMQQRGPGMMGMSGPGDTAVDLLNRITGGEITATKAQLDRLELLLKLSIAASLVAGIAGVASLLRGR